MWFFRLSFSEQDQFLLGIDLDKMCKLKDFSLGTLNASTGLLKGEREKNKL
jgi:hypothetical protein